MDSEGYWEDSVCFVKKPFMCYTDTNNVSQRYTLVSEAMTWAAAREHCRKHHTDLATVHSQRENQEVMEVAGGCSIFWIGLFNEPWEWADGGNASFRSWDNTSPNSGASGNGKCVRTYYKLWRDVSCSSTGNFHCCLDSSNVSLRYTLVSEAKTWAAAREHCREHHTDLVTIHSQRENEEMMEAAGGGGVFWTGLFNEPWKWAGGDGEMVNLPFQFWGSKPPNSWPGGGQCVELCLQCGPTSQWNLTDCDIKQPFYCYGGESSMDACFIVFTYID
ncbi:LY75 protein, partial [Amia calva]|nr:LY75 protein [Amia calva]